MGRVYMLSFAPRYSTSNDAFRPPGATSQPKMVYTAARELACSSTKMVFAIVALSLLTARVEVVAVQAIGQCPR
jgi:hypothetical protein